MMDWADIRDAANKRQATIAANKWANSLDVYADALGCISLPLVYETMPDEKLRAPIPKTAVGKCWREWAADQLVRRWEIVNRRRLIATTLQDAAATFYRAASRAGIPCSSTHDAMRAFSFYLRKVEMSHEV